MPVKPPPFVLIASNYETSARKETLTLSVLDLGGPLVKKYLLESLSNHFGNTLGREVYIRGRRLVRLPSRRDIILKQFQ